MRLFFYCLFFFPAAFSKANANLPIDSVIANCKPTPTISELQHLPLKPVTHNNLRNLVGSFEPANGKKIIIYGRLMDKNCVPITDATITLWQTDASGKFKDEDGFDSNFSGSGVASTDNLGRFSFITIMPAGTSKESPNVNLKITHKNIEEILTKFYLTEDDNQVKINPASTNLSAKQIKQLIASKPINTSSKNNIKHNIYFIDVVSNNIVEYKSY